MTTANALKPFSTTGIGSLPHHNIDAALAHSFQMDIPFLPQIPIRNFWEFMVPQALEGMPGLEVDPSGTAWLDADVWMGRSRALTERLQVAFSNPGKGNAFESFEPSQATASLWQPFLWELEERKLKTAKIQMAGPLTCQWVLKLKNTPKTGENRLEISTQVYQLILARSIAMCRRLKESGIQPLFFIDEPGLYGLIPTDPTHRLRLQELKFMVEALRKEGVWVGLHCCSNTDWKSILDLGFHFISIDAELSLAPLLDQKETFLRFLENGGRLSLGAIPTHRRLNAQTFSAERLFHDLLEVFGKKLGDSPEIVQKVLREALLTPACGLALHSVEDAENTLQALLALRRFCEASLKS